MTYEQFIQKIKDLKIEINQKTSIDDINEKMFKGDIPPFYDDKKWIKNYTIEVKTSNRYTDIAPC